MYSRRAFNATFHSTQKAKNTIMPLPSSQHIFGGLITEKHTKQDFSFDIQIVKLIVEL